MWQSVFASLTGLEVSLRVLVSTALAGRNYIDGLSLSKQSGYYPFPRKLSKRRWVLYVMKVVKEPSNKSDSPFRICYQVQC